MTSRLSDLLTEIVRLEEELEEALHTHEAKFAYRIEGTRIRFEKSVREAHRKLRTGTIQWLRESSLPNVLSAPVIYPMFFVFALLDVAITVYQQICFRLYGIPRVKRSRFVVIDRHQLSYLNSIEKLNCVYCGYVNGVIAYTREISARTEQYWCPVKHARKVLDPHRRYSRFADFGDSRDFQRHVERQRAQVRAQE
jgi:hypothetical protein